MIRPATPRDSSQIDQVIEAAFGQREEADLVVRLREEGVALVELVDESDGQISGHVLFTRMWIETATLAIEAVALAPVAVLPALQRQGIGYKLIHRGLALLQRERERIVIVLGHPEYYPRFGFSAAKAKPLKSPFSGDAFMALELEPGALAGVTGRVRYAQAFGLD